MRYAEYLASRGQIEDAELWVATVVASTNNPAGAHVRFGSHLLNLGRGSGALVHYRRAHELKPDDHFIELGLGQALLDAGHANEAAEALRDAIEHGATTPLAGYDLARALAQTGHRDEAVRALALIDTAADDRDRSADLAGHRTIRARSRRVRRGRAFHRARRRRTRVRSITARRIALRAARGRRPSGAPPATARRFPHPARGGCRCDSPRPHSLRSATRG